MWTTLCSHQKVMTMQSFVGGHLGVLWCSSHQPRPYKGLQYGWGVCVYGSMKGITSPADYVSVLSLTCVCVCVHACMHASGVAVCMYVHWPMHHSTLPLPSPPSCADPSATTHVVQTSEDSKQQTHITQTLETKCVCCEHEIVTVDCGWLFHCTVSHACQQCYYSCTATGTSGS